MVTRDRPSSGEGMDVERALNSFCNEIESLDEIQDIKTEQMKMTERLNSIDQRLADINIHLADQSRRIDETNKRIDRLYEIIVRRDEHSGLVIKVMDLEKRIVGLEQRLAA